MVSTLPCGYVFFIQIQIDDIPLASCDALGSPSGLVASPSEVTQRPCLMESITMQGAHLQLYRANRSHPMHFPALLPLFTLCLQDHEPKDSAKIKLLKNTFAARGGNIQRPAALSSAGPCYV